MAGATFYQLVNGEILFEKDIIFYITILIGNFDKITLYTSFYAIRMKNSTSKLLIERVTWSPEDLNVIWTILM